MHRQMFVVAAADEDETCMGERSLNHAMRLWGCNPLVLVQNRSATLALQPTRARNPWSVSESGAMKMTAKTLQENAFDTN